jgi:ATP-binding cassette, subfamily B, bacterial MsbA
MNAYKKIYQYIKPYWKHSLLNIVFNVISAVFSLVSLTMVIPFLGILFGKVNMVTIKPALSFNPTSFIDYFNYIISDIIATYGKAEALLFICLLVVILFFLKNLFRYLAMFYLANVRNGVLVDLRVQIYNKILDLPISYYTDRRKGDIISRMTNDVTEVEWSVMSSLEMLFREPISIVMFLATLIIMSPQLSLFAFLTLPISILIIGRVGKSLKKTSQKSQAKLGVILSIIEETLSGL